MSDISLFGWKMGGASGRSGQEVLAAVQTEPYAVFDDPQAQIDALKAADSVFWSYDLTRKRFEFKGDFSALDMPPLWGKVAIDELAPLFERGEVERLEAALGALEVRTAAGDGQGNMHCLLRLKDRRMIYMKGRRAGKTAVLGLMTDLSRDLSLQKRHPEAGLAVQDVHIDALTGLYNRPGFLAAARILLQRPGDYDLVVGDLNRFRRLNEALGHERADLVLIMLAQRLRDTFGTVGSGSETSILARLGEDEFAVLTQRGFPRVSERMRNAIERPISVAGFDIHPTFSMGAVSIEGGEEALETAELLRRAELAVEAAKSKGAGGVASYKRDLESDGLTRLALEGELRRAFISGEIHAWYQPIVNLDTGRINGFEALARWVHPKRGVIPPDNFLGAARDLGLMVDLGTIILNASAALAGRWLKNYSLPKDFFISVNLSAPEIERFNLVDDVSRLIRDAGLPRGCLKLEVTESDVMRDPQASARVLDALRDAGAGIALDDFGTGFSSLSYLAKLPFDTLKIDRSFVNTMKNEASSEKIVRSILTLGRDLGLDVVAEGVEDMELADRLAGLGCQMGQGWGFAKALTPTEAEAYLVASLENGDMRSISV